MARRFRFRLETVRRLREQARDAQRRVVAEAARVVRSLEDRITRFSQDVRQVSAQLRDARRGGPMDTALLRRYLQYQGWLQRQISGARTDLAARQAELDRQRAKLTELRRDLEVIEKLRERQWQRYLVEVAREEQLEHDEAAQQQFARCRQWRYEGVA
jgi:flagellar export protein FliJ